MSCLPSNVSFIVKGGPSADLVNICKYTVPDFFLICCFNRRGSTKVVKSICFLNLLKKKVLKIPVCIFSNCLLSYCFFVTSELGFCSHMGASTELSLKGKCALFADLWVQYMLPMHHLSCSSVMNIILAFPSLCSITKKYGQLKN